MIDTYEEYQILAKEAHEALKAVGFDVKLKIISVLPPLKQKSPMDYGIIYSVVMGPSYSMYYFKDIAEKQESKTIVATWLKEHGSKAKCLFNTGERYTRVAFKEWSKLYKTQSVELDDIVAQFGFAICLGYEDPLITFEDAKDQFQNLAEYCFGDALQENLEAVKEEFGKK